MVRFGRSSRTKLAVYSTALVDSADGAMFPAIFKAFEHEFGVGPSTLGRIVLFQSLVHSLSSPFWGYIADYHSRKRLLMVGCVVVAITTLMVAYAESISSIATARACTGLGLAVIAPVAQSVIADLVPPATRGQAFGVLGVMAAVGSMGGTVFASSISHKTINGMSGWRFAFVIVAVLAFLETFVVLFFASDPKRGASDRIVPDDEDPRGVDQRRTPHEARESEEGSDDERGALLDEDAALPDNVETPRTESSEAQGTPRTAVARDNEENDDERSPLTQHSDDEDPTPPKGMREWGWDVLQFFRIRTFVFIVMQGFVGMLPWNAVSFVTMYLQYMGFSDAAAATIFSMLAFGGIFGGFIGGYIGDKMALWSRDHGRVLTAQISVFLGIPFTLVLFTVLPKSTEYGWVYGATMFCIGLTATWTPPACNRPILAEIVPVRSRSSVFAMLIALEGAVGALGAPLVGILSEGVFGYKPRSAEDVDDMSDQTKRTNMEALASACLVIMLVPWCLCFAIYSLVHTSYPSDRLWMQRQRAE